jgi:hypothetical protein
MKHEIASILRDAADRIAAIENKPEQTPAPAMPEPPEGFHPAMMGPIAHYSLDLIYDGDIALHHYGVGWVFDGVGNHNLPYALRIGSDIARLNGLGLKLELGRTYATNAGGIVSGLVKHGLTGMPEQDAFSADVNEWNFIGQALIDGVAQPIDHPDSIREEIPAELLPLPTLPDGFKEWRWRGKAWKSEKAFFTLAKIGLHKWFELGNRAQPASGMDDRYYLEAIPADKPERKAREWDVYVSEGSLLRYSASGLSEIVRVREIIPGEPTMEQVQALVDTLTKAVAHPVIGAWLEDAEKALAPFRK